MTKYALKRLVSLAFLSASMVALPAFAAGPTSQQLKMFNSLPDDQKQALMKQYAPGMVSGSESSSAPVVQEVTQETVVQAREIDQDVTQSEQVEEAKKSTDQADLQEKQVTTAVREAVKPFGYDLFAGAPSTFAPLSNAPVPADYIVGPGDSLNVQVYGAENQSYVLQVDREGRVQLPNVGPVQVAGLSFSKTSELLSSQIKKAMIGVDVSVTAGALRSIRVFVLGDVFKPGAYVVSGLSTMSNALLSSGGIQTIGSLRNIQLKRNGKVISTLDLYDFLLKGDMSNDVSLLDGDVLFVPTLKETVTVAGEVKRPAIYELKGEQTLEQLVKLAGGFSQSASPAHSKLERIREDGFREVQDVNLLSKTALKQSIKNGDTIRVLQAVDEYKDIILVKGSVSRPGEYQWREGLKIADLFSGNASDEFLPRTDLEHVYVKQEVGVERSVELQLVNLDEALSNPNSAENIPLTSRDEILILNYDDDRVAKLAPWVQIMQRQAKRNALPKVVKINGSVNYPGEYPLAEGMSLGDLVSLAGGVTITAMPNALLRHESAFNKKVMVEKINLSEALEQVSMTPMDELIVLDDVNRDVSKQRLEDLNARLKQQATAQQPSQTVQVTGLVRFPGEYPLTKNMTAAELIALAGGVLESGYELSGEVVKRSVDAKSRALNIQTEILEFSGQAFSNYVLSSKDSLVIKQKPDWNETQTVTLTGEVKFPGSYVLEQDETLADIIARAGGFTQDAFIEGTVLQRESLLEKQEEELDKMRAQLEAVIAQNASKKTSVTSSNAMQHLTKILQQANEAKATGRITLVDADSSKLSFENVLLKDGDVITIPEESRTVAVLGEVFASQTFSFDSTLTASEYVQMAGGPNGLADMERAYVVKASGKVVPLEASGFFYASAADTVQQGDVIVVPMDIQKLQPLELWKEVATIAGQVGIALASFNAVGVF